ncbi:MAG: serine/threonine-protein kinase [Planctomycetota bacterium]
MATPKTPAATSKAIEMSDDGIRRLGEAIDAFLQLDSNDETRTLDGIRDHPEELREYLEPMLEHASQCSRGSGETSPVLSESGPSLSGRVLGDFRIEELIGRGGMGVVYSARQLSLDRQVAVKILPASYALLVSRAERFRREAQAAARLRHPNLVAIHTVGEEQGIAYFAMQKIDGESLSVRLRDQPSLPGTAAEFDAVARIGQRVAEALAYAHEQGVVHRDIKPSNILLEPDGTPKVTDFGLAKILDVQDDVSMSGEVLGTPYYMSPEQASGEKQVDGRSDVYSLGVMLFEMVTGRPPFHEGSVQTILRTIQEREIPRLQSINPAVPVDLATIISKAARLEIDDRYASASDLASELRRFLAREPIHARPLAAWQRLIRYTMRHKVFAASAALLVTLLSVLAWSLGDLANWRRRADDVADVSAGQDLLFRIQFAISQGQRPSEDDLRKARKEMGDAVVQAVLMQDPELLEIVDGAVAKMREEALRSGDEDTQSWLLRPRKNISEARPVFVFRMPPLEENDPERPRLALYRIPDSVDLLPELTHFPITPTDSESQVFELPPDVVLTPEQYMWWIEPTRRQASEWPAFAAERIDFRVLPRGEVPEVPRLSGELSNSGNVWLARIGRLLDADLLLEARDVLTDRPTDVSEVQASVAERLEVEIAQRLGDRSALERLLEQISNR